MVPVAGNLPGAMYIPSYQPSVERWAADELIKDCKKAVFVIELVQFQFTGVWK